MRIFWCITLLNVASSLMTSWVVDTFLRSRIAIIGKFFGLERSYNSGIAFGWNLGPYQDLLIVIALGIVFVVALRSARTAIDWTAFGAIIGGGAANILDRAADGVVTDMIQIGSFPIFNLADIWINIGVAMLLWTGIRE